MANKVSWFLAILSKPGAKQEVHGTAPTQKVFSITDEQGEKQIPATIGNITGYVSKVKPRLLDRALDRVVQASGSEFTFFTIMAALLTWAFLGIPFGTNTNWQIIISDVQAIVSYIFDSFLMRQQLNSYDEEMTVAAELRSRILSHGNMLKTIYDELGEDQRAYLTGVTEQQGSDQFEAELPQESWFGRFATSSSIILGHIISVCLFWVCIFVWIGLGSYTGWSNSWQLYMNSASSAFMVFIFAFLANIRERHSAYTKSCLDAIFHVDSALETKLRLLTGNKLDNDLVILPAPKMNILQRGIFYYADVVGTLVGILLLMAVIVVWVVIGPAMEFSSNWWLLIGTYAGLVGMNDGFVLRNVQARLRGYEDDQFAKVDEEDAKLFEIIGLAVPEKRVVDTSSLSQRVSETMCQISAHEITVLAGFLTIVGLLAVASAMRWSLTGQLLCNVPPSLIESFFMLILITGHNAVDAKSRINLRNVYERRLRLLSFASGVTSEKAP